jgi:glutathione peroxidase
MPVLLGLLLVTGLPGEDAAKKGVPASLRFVMKSLDGTDVNLADYQGKVVLIVNVASDCGATPQYAALQALHEKYGERGLVVLGFPCNQFGGQEPGSAAEIRSFCTKNYGVTFPLFSKIEVRGDQAAPLYRYLTSPQTNPQHAGPIRWNFEKFLLGRTGQIVARFETGVEPDAPEVAAAIESELQQGP